MRRLAPLFLALPLLACGDDDDSAGGSANFPTAVADQAISNYKRLVNANYADVLTTATALKTAIAAFVAAPSDATQKAAQDAWIAARLPYGPSEAFRFYDGPIDDPDDGPEGLINAWPLDENYIDYTRDDLNAGIVNDPADDLSLTQLTTLNTAMGEKAISTGYHALEFLLWGQDDATPGMGAGKRNSPTTSWAAPRPTRSAARRTWSTSRTCCCRTCSRWRTSGRPARTTTARSSA